MPVLVRHVRKVPDSSDYLSIAYTILHCRDFAFVLPWSTWFCLDCEYLSFYRRYFECGHFQSECSKGGDHVRS